MIIDKKHGPIGQWRFEGAEQFLAIGRSEIQAYMISIAKAVHALQEMDLLTPTELKFVRWAYWDDDANEYVTTHFPDVTVSLADDPNANIMAVIQTEVNKASNLHPNSFPWEVFIYGNGIFFDAHGKPSRGENVLWLKAEMFGGIILTLNTQADVWLPFDLNGAAQTSTSEYNQPRLTEVLEKLVDLTGVEIVVAEEPGKLAKSTKYGLENLMNPAGTGKHVFKEE